MAHTHTHTDRGVPDPPPSPAADPVESLGVLLSCDVTATDRCVCWTHLPDLKWSKRILRISQNQ